jgi:signal peptidase I
MHLYIATLIIFINGTAGDTILFRDIKDYQNFIDKYNKYLSPYFDTYAYCLIPNHYHIVAREKESFEESILSEDTNSSKNYRSKVINENTFLENQLSRICGSISLRHNNKYKINGPVFKERTKRVIIRNQERLINQICFTHRNSFHQGLVKNYEDWKFNSFILRIKRK